jgi:hypothetical protein
VLTCARDRDLSRGRQASKSRDPDSPRAHPWVGYVMHRSSCHQRVPCCARAFPARPDIWILGG